MSSVTSTSPPAQVAPHPSVHVSNHLCLHSPRPRAQCVWGVNNPPRGAVIMPLALQSLVRRRLVWDLSRAPGPHQPSQASRKLPDLLCILLILKENKLHKWDRWFLFVMTVAILPHPSLPHLLLLFILKPLPAPPPSPYTSPRSSLPPLLHGVRSELVGGRRGSLPVDSASPEAAYCWNLELDLMQLSSPTLL